MHFSCDISKSLGILDYIWHVLPLTAFMFLFSGYNVTVLAYGQTGSGKTHTMGTTYVSGVENSDDAGIIPQAVQDIFKVVADQTDNEYLIRVSFIEVRNLFCMYVINTIRYSRMFHIH